MEEAATPRPAEWEEQWRDPGLWAARAARLGPLRFSDLGERWLSPPGDGIPSWLVDAVDRWWEDAGRPDPFVLAVVSADDGNLARSVLGAGPECLTALRYVMVDPEAQTRAGQKREQAASSAVGLEEPAFLFPSRKPTGAAGGSGRAGGGFGDPHDNEAEFDDDFDPDEPAPPARGVGPLVTRLGGLPVVSDLAAFRGSGPSGVVVAVGVLSRLTYDLVELGEDGGWCEVRLTLGEGGSGLSEVVVPLGPGQVESLPEPVATTRRPGRYAVQGGAARWLRGVLSSTPAGVIAVVDQWAPDGSSLGQLAYDQLRRVREPSSGPEPIGPDVAVVTWAL